MDDKSKKLNPQIQEVLIGVRELRPLKIYPLSAADQFKFGDVITKFLQETFLEKNLTDIELISFFVELLMENIARLLTLVTDHTSEAAAKKLLKDITNSQANDIAQIIYEVNYAVVEKNVKRLFGGINKTFLSKRPLQPSVNGIPSTDLSTSTGNHLETEGLPSDK